MIINICAPKVRFKIQFLQRRFNDIFQHYLHQNWGEAGTHKHALFLPEELAFKTKIVCLLKTKLQQCDEISFWNVTYLRNFPKLLLYKSDSQIGGNIAEAIDHIK